jgi:hypothetical protein
MVNPDLMAVLLEFFLDQPHQVLRDVEVFWPFAFVGIGQKDGLGFGLEVRRILKPLVAALAFPPLHFVLEEGVR